MVWYQGKLLVTAADGLYVYDMHRIQRATVDSGQVGKVRGGWAAYGSKYVLPAVALVPARRRERASGGDLPGPQHRARQPGRE